MTEEDQDIRSAEEGTGIDRPLCSVCNTRLADKMWTSLIGKVTYRKTCSICRRREGRWAKEVKGTALESIKGYRKKALLAITPHNCSYCGFEPLHICQIHVDHVDGNHKNNKIDNLQLLCANCHAFKTWAHKDSKQWKYTDPSDRRKES